MKYTLGSRPTALQIVKDEDAENKLKGVVILLTGAASGIGVETAKALATTGATVYCAVRDIIKAKEALKQVQGRIELLELDLSSLSTVSKAADEFLQRSGGKLNILINNAGVMAIQEQKLSVDGYEMQFATNHLGHFLLFQKLKQALKSSSTPSFHSRVVIVASAGHNFSPIHFDSYNLDGGEYDPWKAYGQSKTANIYMSNAIERKYGSQGLHGLALHPGNIWTPLQRHLDKEVVDGFRQDEAVQAKVKTVDQGAATTVLAAIGKDFEGIGGKYLEDCCEGGPLKEGGNCIVDPGYASWAFSPEYEDRLWKDSCKMVGVDE